MNINILIPVGWMTLLFICVKGYLINAPCNWLLAIVPIVFMTVNSIEDYILDMLIEKYIEKEKDDEE